MIGDEEINEFNLKYCIGEYFDSLVNKIDVLVETQLKRLAEEGHSEHFKSDYFNSLRQTFLREIYSAKEENFAKFEQTFAYITIEQRQTTSANLRIDLVEKHLFKRFCFLWHRPEYKPDPVPANQIFLFSTDCYFNVKEIEHMR